MKQLPELKLWNMIYFGNRYGQVVGFTVLDDAKSEPMSVETSRVMAIVELDKSSAAYLEETRDGYGQHDCFVSLVLVNMENFMIGEEDGYYYETS